MGKSKYPWTQALTILVNTTMIQWKICTIITTHTIAEGRRRNQKVKVPNMPTQIHIGGDDRSLLRETCSWMF